MPKKQSAADIQKLRNQFFQVPGVCLAVMVGAHVLTSGGFIDKSDKDMRLILTAGYFGAVFTLLYYATKPREDYMRKYFEWRFEDAGPSMTQVWKLYLLSVSRLARAAAWVLMALIGCTALGILAQWPEFSTLMSFSTIYTLGWWLSLIAVFALPFVGGNLFSEPFQRYRVLTESLETSTFKPRDAKDLMTADQPEAPPVETVGDHEFRAGGMNWSWEDFYKNSIIFGQSGTGKTVCVLNALVDGMLASSADSQYPPSGLMLDPKGDFYSKIQTVLGNYGRGQDLLVIDPYKLDRSIRWNPFDTDDDELEVAARFGAVLESTGQQAGGSDAFWIDSAKKFIRHSIALLRAANRGEPPSFAQINSMAVSKKAISEFADMVDDEDGSADQALLFFTREWFDLADNTRTSILAYITNMIDPFLMEPYATLFSGRSTMRISDIIDSGKLLYVYMPIADKERMSRVICTFVKLEYYREVLKRPDKVRSSFFLCDEFQAFFTVTPGKGDADFFERSRQSRHANIIATQNFPALLKQSGDKESIVKNLLGNCAVKMFLRNTDDMTNNYASELFGQDMVTVLGSSVGAASGKSVGGSSSASANRQYDARVRKEEFVELAVPSKRDEVDYCETIVHMAARGFVTKEKLRWKVHPLKG
jgi:hypothetical protein